MSSSSHPDPLIVASAAHEVSNALSAIRGWVHLARAATSAEMTEEALSLIETSANLAAISLSALRGITESTGPTETANVARLEPVRLDRLLRQVERLALPECTSRNGHIHLDCPASLVALGDRVSLLSVLWNLVKNALESRPQGVTVHLRARPEEGHVAIEVQDDGPGMSEEQQSQCFEPGYTTKRIGRGLGLYIVAKTVTRFEGTLAVEAVVTGGTQFTITMPAATMAACPAAKRPPQSIRILVIDNDGPIRELIHTALSLEGYSVVTVASPDSLGDQQFELALIDLHLDHQHGDEVAQALSHQGVIQKVAFLSGMEYPDRLCVEPDQWLRKPFDLEQLLDVVHAMSSSLPTGP